MLRHIFVLGVFSSVCFALPPLYQEKAALEKQGILWREILSSEYDVLPDVDIDSFITQALSALEGATKRDKLRETFEWAEDTMPADKGKFIHAYGTVFKLEYRAAKEAADLGILGEKSVPVIGRLSLAAPEAGGFTPGAAFKFLRTGKTGLRRPSVNIVVMHSLEGQGDDDFFFRHDFSSDLPPVQKPAISKDLDAILDLNVRGVFDRLVGNRKGEVSKYLFLKMFESKFAKVHGTPRHLPIDPFLVTTSELKEAPLHHRKVDKLVFRASPEAKAAYLTSRHGDYRLKLSDLPANIRLYDVYDGQGALLGSLYIAAKAVASGFGDDELFFQHHH